MSLRQRRAHQRIDQSLNVYDRRVVALYRQAARSGFARRGIEAFIACPVQQSRHPLLRSASVGAPIELHLRAQPSAHRCTSHLVDVSAAAWHADLCRHLQRAMNVNTPVRLESHGRLLAGMSHADLRRLGPVDIVEAVAGRPVVAAKIPVPSMQYHPRSPQQRRQFAEQLQAHASAAISAELSERCAQWASVRGAVQDSAAAVIGAAMRDAKIYAAVSPAYAHGTGFAQFFAVHLGDASEEAQRSIARCMASALRQHFATHHDQLVAPFKDRSAPQAARVETVCQAVKKALGGQRLAQEIVIAMGSKPAAAEIGAEASSSSVRSPVVAAAMTPLTQEVVSAGLNKPANISADTLSSSSSVSGNRLRSPVVAAAATVGLTPLTQEVVSAGLKKPAKIDAETLSSSSSVSGNHLRSAAVIGAAAVGGCPAGLIRLTQEALSDGARKPMPGLIPLEAQPERPAPGLVHIGRRMRTAGDKEDESVYARNKRQMYKHCASGAESGIGEESRLCHRYKEALYGARVMQRRLSKLDFMSGADKALARPAKRARIAARLAAYTETVKELEAHYELLKAQRSAAKKQQKKQKKQQQQQQKQQEKPPKVPVLYVSTPVQSCMKEVTAGFGVFDVIDNYRYLDSTRLHQHASGPVYAVIDPTMKTDRLLRETRPRLTEHVEAHLLATLVQANADGSGVLRSLDGTRNFHLEANGGGVSTSSNVVGASLAKTQMAPAARAVLLDDDTPEGTPKLVYLLLHDTAAAAAKP